MTCGFPNSFLVANGLDPEVLMMLPEDLRMEQMISMGLEPIAENAA